MDIGMMLNDEEQATLLQTLLESLQRGSVGISTVDFDSAVDYASINTDCSFTGPIDIPFGIIDAVKAGSYNLGHCPSLEFGISSGDSLTTIMIRNVPRKCTQRMLFHDIVTAGYGNVVDFVYLPTDISSARNLGYAFINFINPHYAECFRESFHKKHLSSIRGPRAGLSISYALIQGLQANIDNVFKSSSIHRIRNPEYLPLVFGEKKRLVPC